MHPKFPTRFLRDVYPVFYREWREAGFDCPNPGQLGSGRFWREFTVFKLRVPYARYEKRGDFYYRDFSYGRRVV